MQVGPAISPSPESKLTLDLKEYASRPLTFIHRQLLDHGPEVTRELIDRARMYPFISDLFGEWLARNNHRSAEAASAALAIITREVIGNMSLTDLCEMLQTPLKLLVDDQVHVASSTISAMLRELHLSVLASKIDQHSALINPEDLEKILSGDESVSPLQPETAAANYSEFLTELREAGVVIPPSSKERQSRTQAKKSILQEEKPVTPARAVAKPPTVKAKAPTFSVESLLSPDGREKIMSKIFKDDEEDFGRSMELLNKAKDWKQASIYLDALFMRRKVDPYSKTATRLTDAVYARFNSLR
jgi:hypothetical protein